MSAGKTPQPGNLGPGEWLRGQGPDEDIAICTRVRLARNVDGYRFSPCMTDEEARDLNAYVARQVATPEFPERLRQIEIGGLDEIERTMLMERHLISREHVAGDRARSVLVNEDESVSLMVNEEDHIRAQVFRSGFQVDDTYARAERIDNALLASLPLAFSEQFGFLTSCPTNTGTGLRVSVMLHLPGLGWINDIEKVTATAQKINLAVRGLYGEGSRALGDLYQVSNQVTLGKSEPQILADVQEAVKGFMTWERNVREALLQGEPRAKTCDRIFRAYGVLERAHIIASDEALQCLSAVRFGIRAGLIQGVTIEDLNRALLLSQPAHLQRVFQTPLQADVGDVRRASLIRSILHKG
jgi:protein arginine kinase